MARKKEFKNVASYSSSKKKMLVGEDSCRRQYFYYCYGYWKGWWNKSRPPEGGPRAEQVYNAKHVENRFSWAGKVVHTQAAWGLKTAMEGRQWSREELRNTLLERARNMIDKGLDQARNQHAGNPKYRLQLVEILKNEEFDEDWLREYVRDRIIALTSVDDAWSGLPQNVNLYMRAMNNRQGIVVVEDLVSFEIEDMPVWLSIDLMMRHKRNPLTHGVILDWKTGRFREANEDQLHTYKAWAKSLNWQDVNMFLVHLGEGKTEVIEVSSNEDSVEITRKNVIEYKNILREMLVDGDIERNEPIEEKFTPTTNPQKCRDCAFQFICERDGTKPEDNPTLDDF